MSFSAAELLFQSLHKFKNFINQVESPSDSQQIDDELNDIYREVRLNFRDTIKEHLQSTGYIYLNLSDAESILELLEVVVSEYSQVFTTSAASSKLKSEKGKTVAVSSHYLDSGSETPRSKRPKLDLPIEESLATLRYLFFCCYNIASEPLFCENLYPKCVKICEKCLSTLADRGENLFIRLVDEVVELVEEVLSALPLFQTWSGVTNFVNYEISLQAFDCRMQFEGCNLSVQFQSCLDIFVKFSFDVMENLWNQYLAQTMQQPEKVLPLKLIKNCLFNSSLETKISVAKSLPVVTDFSTSLIKGETFDSKFRSTIEKDVTSFVKSVSLYAITLSESKFPKTRSLMSCISKIAMSLINSDFADDIFVQKLLRLITNKINDFADLFHIIGDFLNDFLKVVYFRKEFYYLDVSNLKSGVEKIELDYVAIETLLKCFTDLDLTDKLVIDEGNLFDMKINNSKFLAIISSLAKFKPENNINSNLQPHILRSLLENVLIQTDLKFNSTPTKSEAFYKCLQSLDIIMGAVSFCGLNSAVYLEVLSAELLFDCVSVVKKAFFKPNIAINELLTALLIVQKFMLLTFPLQLDANLLFDIIWCASVNFSWFDLKNDWKELEPLKSQESYVSAIKNLKSKLNSASSELKEQLTNVSMAIILLSFQNFSSKTVSAILLVHISNLFKKAESYKTFTKNLPSVIWTLLISDPKIAEQLLTAQFLKLDAKILRFEDLRQIVWALKFPITAEESKIGLQLNPDELVLKVTECFVENNQTENCNLKIQPCDQQFWSAFILPLLNKLKLSSDLTNEEILELIEEIAPLSPNFDDILSYIVDFFLKNDDCIFSKLTSTLSMVLKIESQKNRVCFAFWDNLTKAIQDSKPLSDAEFCDFHLNKIRILAFILENCDSINSNRPEVQHFSNFGFNSLIEYLFSNNPSIRKATCEALKSACVGKTDFELGDCFTHFKESICDTWSAISSLKFETFCNNSSPNNNRGQISISELETISLDFVEQLVLLCQAFEIEPSPGIVRGFSPLILPNLFLINSKLAFVFCKEIGTQLMKQDIEDFVNDSLVPIVAFLLSRGVEDPKTVFETCFPKIVEKWNSFILSKLVPITFSVASYLDSYTEEVVNIALPYLAEIDFSFQDAFKKRTAKIDTTEVSKLYLSHRLLAIMTNFKTVLLSGSAGKVAKVRRLKSTVKIVELLNKDSVSFNDMKLLDILRLIPKLKFDDYVSFMVEAYSKLVSNLHSNNIQKLASQIAYDIAEINTEASKELLKVLNSSFAEDLLAFYILPSCDQISQQSEILQNVKTFENVLSHLAVAQRCLREETIETKFFVLQNFLKILSTNPEVPKFFVDLEALPESNKLVNFVQTLIVQFNVDSSEIQHLVAQILGFIGAIDASKIVDLRSLASKTGFKTECTTDTIEFKKRLLTILVQSLTSSCNSEPRMVDCSAYSIQELLKVFECNSSYISGSGRKLWESFDEEHKAFLAPYLKSKYSYNCRNLPNSSENVKFYVDESIITYKQWICKLVKHLASFVQDSKSFAIFSACDAVLNYNVDVATFLLPVIIIQLISENNENCKSLVIQEFLKVLRDVHSGKPRPFAKVCSQTVFLTLETISNYENTVRSDKLWEKAKRVDSSGDTKNPVLVKCDLLSEFLSHIMSNTIAKAAFACKAYARALFYAEDHLSKLDDTDSELSLMQKCFLELNEPDGVKGVNAIRSRRLNDIEKILNYKSQNKMNEAFVCCSTAISKNRGSVNLIKEYLNCFLAVGQADSAKYHASGYLAENKGCKAVIEPICMEACWQLSDWSKLSEMLANHNQAFADVKLCQPKNDFKVDFSSCMLALSENNWSNLDKNLKMARNAQICNITAATMDYSNSYLRAYEAVAKLHTVSSVELVSDLLKNKFTSNSILEDVEKVCDQLESRMQVLQPSFNIVEPERQLYRCLLEVIKKSVQNSDQMSDKVLNFLDRNIRKSWLDTSKAARAIGYYDTALKGLQNSFSDSEPNFENVLEHSLLLNCKGSHYEGLMYLQKFLANQNITLSSANKISNENDRKLISKIYLQIGKFMEETRSVESNQIIAIYKHSIELCREQEDSYYCLGSYYEKFIEQLGQSSAKNNKDTIMPKVHQFYIDSLSHGNKFVFQALPRLISIWLDQGSKFHSLLTDSEKQTQTSERTAKVNQIFKNVEIINRTMSKVVDDGTIAPYQLFTAFSQLLSRICHPVESVFQVLKKLLVKLIREYPQQALWLSVAVRNSSVQLRSERCAQIFDDAKRNPNFAKLFHASVTLTNHLKDLCEKNPNVVPPEMSVSLKSMSPKMHKLLINNSFSDIIIPRMDSLTASIPESKPHNFQPFRDDKVCIASFDDRVDVLMSMQRPKKIVVIGSDGNEYPMMAKPKDDMRKDYRVLECNVIMNQFLLRDAEARKRQLHIRTYAVIALDKENGLVEWIKNTTAFRSICYRIYKERNMGLSPR